MVLVALELTTSRSWSDSSTTEPRQPVIPQQTKKDRLICSQLFPNHLSMEIGKLRASIKRKFVFALKYLRTKYIVFGFQLPLLTEVE
jgi:hypothetical protein